MGKKKDKKRSVFENESEKDTTGNESKAPTIEMPSGDIKDDKIESGEDSRENSDLNTNAENFKPKENGSGNPLLKDICPNLEATYDQSSAQNSIEANPREEVKENKTDLKNEGSVKLEKYHAEPVESHTQGTATPRLDIENLQSKGEEPINKAASSEPNPPLNSEEKPKNEEETTNKAASSEPNPPLNSEEKPKNEEETTNKVALSELNPSLNSKEKPKNEEEPTNKAASSQPNPSLNSEEKPKNEEEPTNKAASSELKPSLNSEEKPKNEEEPTNKAASSELKPSLNSEEKPKNEEEPTNKAASSELKPSLNSEEKPKNEEESTNKGASSQPNISPTSEEEPRSEHGSHVPENEEEPTNKAASSELKPSLNSEEKPKNEEESTNKGASSQPNIPPTSEEEPRSEHGSHVPVIVTKGLTKPGSSSSKTTSPAPKSRSIEASSTPSLPKRSLLQESPRFELKGDSNELSSPSPVPLKSPVRLPFMGSPKAFKKGSSPKRRNSPLLSSRDRIHGANPKGVYKDHPNNTSDQLQGLKVSQEPIAKENDGNGTQEVSRKKGLNFLSPAPINVPENTTLEDLEKTRTADLMDVDLNDASNETTAKAELTTPAKIEKSKYPEKNTEGSTISNLISRLSPNKRPETQSSISPPLPPRGSSTKKHSVPPPLEQEMQSEEFRRNLASTRARDAKGPARPSLDRAKRLDSAAEINLIANRFKESRQSYQTEDETSKENIEKGQSALKSSFSTFLESLPATPVKPADKVEESPAVVADLSLEARKELRDDELHLLKTDWFFWTQVVNDFGSVAANPEKLEKKIADGIPQQIRGIIWQLIANSKSVEFEDIYNTLRDTASSHESAIRRDMKRTKFIPENKFESLFNVIKVYSVFDPDVGYTQGMAFIVTPLLLNTETEAEAFGLLVRLMKGYGLRRMYLQEMPGLMVMLYQFDRLLEENSPQLYNHLTRQGVRSSMYATQWFLTFFAYKFPLEFVLRIYDIVFMEGVESFLKFAVNLVLKNIDSLLNLQFDKLLDFLKDELFFYYLKANVEQRKIDLRGDAALLKKDINSIDSSQKHGVAEDEEYDADQFVHDAMNDVHITPISLRRYTSEYDEIHEIEQQKEAQYESMRIKNRQLQKEVRKLENSYTLLNREHVDIANELIKNRLKIETLSDENNDMKITILELRKQLDEVGRKQSTSSPDNGLPSDIRQDLKRTIKRNSEVMNENLKLQDRVTELERLLATLKTQQAVTASANANPAPNVPREKLSTSWSGFRKVFKKEEGAPPK